MTSFLTALAVAAAIGCAVGLALLPVVFRERKKCGTCAFYDVSLHRCWAKDEVMGTEDGACVGYRIKGE